MVTKTIPWFLSHVHHELSQSEKPLGSNQTKYGKRFGWNGVSWCVEFGWCMYDAAGVALPVKTASCVVLYDACVKAGLRYDSTSCVPGDSVVRTWQRVARTAAGFNYSQTHFQIVTEVKNTAEGKMLGLIGGNQGAGYVGPAVEWVKAGDPSILGGLAFHRLFTVPVAAPVPHDKKRDAKALPAAKSHPTALAAHTRHDANHLAKSLKGRTRPVGKGRAALRRARRQITRVLRIKRKDKP